MKPINKEKKITNIILKQFTQCHGHTYWYHYINFKRAGFFSQAAGDGLNTSCPENKLMPA